MEIDDSRPAAHHHRRTNRPNSIRCMLYRHKLLLRTPPAQVVTGNDDQLPVTNDRRAPLLLRQYDPTDLFELAILRVAQFNGVVPAATEVDGVLVPTRVECNPLLNHVSEAFPPLAGQVELLTALQGHVCLRLTARILAPEHVHER